MDIQQSLPLEYTQAIKLNAELTLFRNGDDFFLFNPAGPIYSGSERDVQGKRIIIAALHSLKLASAPALADAFGVSQATVYRNAKTYREQGVSDLLTKSRGHRSAHKLTQEKQIEAQQLLNKGYTNTKVATHLGITEGTIRNALKRGWIKKPTQGKSCGTKPQSSSERAAVDRQSAQGVGVKRFEDRAAARLGLLKESKPAFASVEGVSGGGVLLALPALLHQGLLSVGQSVFGDLKNGFFGLQAILLVFAFMALLRIKTTEQLTGQSPGELGLLLGLDRAPEVKTLRRKLSELGARKQASVFSVRLTEHWISLSQDSSDDEIGFLYIDGHVRAYHGRKHALPKTHVARRRLCMPATTDFWVNGVGAEPLFFVTAEANDHLLSVLESALIPQIQRDIASNRRITLIFDREGWSPYRFQTWSKQGIDVITYQKGTYEMWPSSCFRQVEGELDGHHLSYRLGERSIQIKPGFWMREVRRLCDSGHQTSILTTRQDISLLSIGHRMFSRWQQENFFRYMRSDFNIDHSPTYAVEPADSDRKIPNPAIKKIKKDRIRLAKELNRLNKLYVQMVQTNVEETRRTYQGTKVSKTEVAEHIDTLTKQDTALKQTQKSLPKTVPLHEVKQKDSIIRLEQERKIIVDSIKVLAFRAESDLLAQLNPFFARNGEEGRKFLKSVFSSPADLIPNEAGTQLHIRIHGLSNPRTNACLESLCHLMNQKACKYPDTELQLVFSVV